MTLRTGMTLCVDDFKGFFQGLTDHGPFHWQSDLACRWAEDGIDLKSPWAETIAIPTSLGKTEGVILAWLFTLAFRIERMGKEHVDVPRRLFHVVDRRTVVDESWNVAQTIRERLSDASADGVLGRVASLVRGVASSTPVRVGRMRGGVQRDDEWFRDPTAAAIISTTVDQIGSAIVFRHYRARREMASIYAALTACDAMIVLDEAHLSEPFARTLETIKREHRDPLRPLALVRMSATSRAPATVALGPEDLRTDLVRLRTRTPKNATVVKVNSATEDATVAAEIDRLVATGRMRIAVVRNTVGCARRSFSSLRKGRGRDTVLMIGRSRPVDRDRVVRQWSPVLELGSKTDMTRPVVVVCTQCIEVGVDFDFDAMITDVASLEALRQRLGRLGRAGGTPCPVMVLVRDDEDPVYGPSATAVGSWLLARQNDLDLCWDRVEDMLRSTPDDERTTLHGEPLEVPVLSSDILDLWARTFPRPSSDPLPDPFLHGYGCSPEVMIAWRSDLDPADSRLWADTVALVPPSSREYVSVPIWEAVRFLAGKSASKAGDMLGDIPVEDREQVANDVRRCLVWRRTADASVVVDRPRDISPGDVLVVPAIYGGHDDYGWSGNGKDIPEDVQLAVDADRGRLRVRVHERMLPASTEPAWKQHVEPMLAVDDPYFAAILDAVIQVLPVDDPIRGALASLYPDGQVCGASLYPDGHGVVFVPKMSERMVDEDDLSDSPVDVTLDTHQEDVERWASRFADILLPPHLAVIEAKAGKVHDEGKVRPRWQLMLPRRDDADGVLLAKGQLKGHGKRTLPSWWRHEFSSVEMVERTKIPQSSWDPDLLLYLVGTHHGYGRPFAPPCADRRPERFSRRIPDTAEIVEVSSDYRFMRVDGGWASLFTNMTRRHGRWNLAFLETILRLADWEASRERDGSTKG